MHVSDCSVAATITQSIPEAVVVSDWAGAGVSCDSGVQFLHWGWFSVTLLRICSAFERLDLLRKLLPMFNAGTSNRVWTALESAVEFLRNAVTSSDLR